jgi:hypothetical protein
VNRLTDFAQQGFFEVHQTRLALPDKFGRNGGELIALQVISSSCLTSPPSKRSLQTQGAVVRNIEIIGEAVNKINSLAPEFIQSHPELPWAQMRKSPMRSSMK